MWKKLSKVDNLRSKQSQEQLKRVRRMAEEGKEFKKRITSIKEEDMCEQVLIKDPRKSNPQITSLIQLKSIVPHLQSV